MSSPASVAPSSGIAHVPTALVALRTSLTDHELFEAFAERDAHIVRRLEDGCVLALTSQSSPGIGVFVAMRGVARVIDRVQDATVHVAMVTMRESRRGPMFFSKDLDQVDMWAVRRDERLLSLTPAALAALVATEVAPPMPTSQRNPMGFAATARSDSGDVGSMSADRMPDPPFVGRDELLSTVAGEARRTIEDAAPILVTILGDAGLGKTRFADELVTRIANQFGLAWKFRGSGNEEIHGSSLSRQLAQRVFGLSDDCTVEHVRAACSARLSDADAASLWPPVAHALGLLGDDAPELAPMRNTPGALRRALARAMGRALLGAAAERPICIVLDDAHLVDPATLDALEIATLSESRGALFVLVTASPSLLHQRSMWGERAARHVRHDLTPLATDAADRVVRALFAPVDMLPDPVVARLRDMTAGVPLQLVEVAHTLWMTGKVRKRREASGCYLAADELLDMSTTPLADRLARRILAELPPSLGEILRIACILGNDVERRDVDAVQAAFPTEHSMDSGVGLQRLVERGLLVEAAKDLFRFKYATTRDALETLMSPDARSAYHEAALRYLESRQGERSRLLHRVARHAAACGARPQAAAAYMELAEQAMSKHVSLDAEAFATQALRHLDDDDTNQRERVLTLRSEARSYLGQYDDSLADSAAALALAEGRGDVLTQADSLLRQAEIHDFRNDRAASAAAVERAASIVDLSHDALLEARLFVARGRTLWRMGQSREAIPLLERGAEMAAALGDSRTQCISLLMLPSALIQNGQVEMAANRFDQVVTLCERVGDRFHLAVAIGNRMVLWVKLQDYARAMTDQRAVTIIARELGNVLLEALALGNLGELLYYCGDYQEALIQARRSDLLLRQQLEHNMPEFVIAYVRSEAIAGHHDIAKQRMQEALDMFGSNVTPFARTMFDLVDMLLADPSTDQVSEWTALIDRLEECAQTDEDIDAMYHAAERAIRVGHPERAAIFISRARPKIRGEVWRKRFDALESS